MMEDKVKIKYAEIDIHSFIISAPINCIVKHIKENKYENVYLNFLGLSDKQYGFVVEVKNHSLNLLREGVYDLSIFMRKAYVRIPVDFLTE